MFSLGAYEVLEQIRKLNLTILASGSETKSCNRWRVINLPKIKFILK